MTDDKCKKNYRTRAIITRSLFETGVKNIQAAAYNDARTVDNIPRYIICTYVIQVILTPFSLV